MQPRGYTGYCHRIICAQDYSAVTGRLHDGEEKYIPNRSGADEELQVAFNDIDFCMKIRKAGKLIVYNPYAELYHYESKSRDWRTRRRKWHGLTGKSRFSKRNGRIFSKRGSVL